MTQSILTPRSEPSTDRAVEYAKTYLDGGLAVVPLSLDEKTPVHKDWPELAAARAFTLDDFAGRNVGVVLGRVSQNLTDIDLDSAAAIALAPYFLPPTLTFGRASKPVSHWLYYCEGVRSLKHRFTTEDGETELIEVRSTNAASDRCGSQTAFPGSTHPSGEPVEFTDEAIEPAKIEAGDLLWRICRLTVASIIAQRYSEGAGRNAQTLGLAGGLLKAGWTADEVTELFDAVRAVSGDDREKDRSAVERTIDNFASGQEVTGFGTLLEDGTLPEQTIAEIQKHCRTPETRAKEAMMARSKALGSKARERLLAEARETDGMLAAQAMGASAVGAANESEQAEAETDAASPEEQRTDLGNARRLVRIHGADLRFFKARNLWYTWDGARWKADETGAVMRAAKATAESLWEEAKVEGGDAFKFAAQCQNKNRLANMISLAESEPGIPVTAADLDADPWLLNVANGTLDLRTGELREPDRALLMTKVTASPYVAGARSELWDLFLERLTGGDAELAAYIQRAIGYALFGAWREKMFWFGYGPPDGAKSTLLGVLSDVLGDYAVSADASTWMLQHNVGGNRGDVTRLMGARLVTTLEVRPGARFDPALMKSVTGGDALTYAAKFEHEISFRPSFALWFGANERPIIPDDDDGFWNRVRCVPFVNVIPKTEQDKALREKLAAPEHAPAVLAWAVAGCLAWQRNGIGTCAAVETATREYRRDMNQAAGFFDECCEADPDPLGPGVVATALRHAYEQWCKANGVQRALQGKAWRRRLLALGATGGDDDSRDSKGQRRWLGIRLRKAG